VLTRKRGSDFGHRLGRTASSGGEAADQHASLMKRKRTILVALLFAAIAGCVDQNHDVIVALLQYVSTSGSPQADFDSVRHFIQAHSVHRNDDEVNSIRQNRGFAQEVLKQVRGERPDPVPMICGARAHLMHDLLEEMGYDAKVVHIFDAASPASHTFLRVMNPETGRWETQDPDFNIFWRAVNSGIRIAVADYAPDHLDEVEPCTDQRCGWDVITKANKLRGLFDRVKIDN
jgi:hypothetical protein